MQFLQMYTSYSSGSESLRNYYGPSPSTAPSTQLSTAPLPPQPIQPPQPTPCNLYSTPVVPPPASNLLTTNTASYVGLNHISPLPTRRYSYSGSLPPSISISDNLNLMHNQDSNITNLITETCQSISRSSNILNRQLSADMASYSCQSLSNLIEDNIESDIVKYDLINEITTTASAAPLKFPNFYTHARKLPYVPPFPPTVVPLVPPYRNQPHLISDDYLLSKPIFSKNLNTFTSSYIGDDYHYAEPQTYTQTHYPTSHHHYASNPCLSSQYPQNHLSYTHHPMSSAFNRNYYQSHHQQPFSSRPPSISSLNRYSALSNNYSSSFNAQPYYRTSSRIDLDNPNKGGEIKRQVSFKFDVDQMSFDP